MSDVFGTIIAYLNKLGTLLNDRRFLTVLMFVVVPLLATLGVFSEAVPESVIVDILSKADTVVSAAIAFIGAVGGLSYVVGKLIESYGVRPPSGLDAHKTPKG